MPRLGLESRPVCVRERTLLGFSPMEANLVDGLEKININVIREFTL